MQSAYAKMLEDLLAPVINAMDDWIEELVEVPELPVCFGDCGEDLADCGNCPDDDECSQHECHECEFSCECNAIEQDMSAKDAVEPPEGQGTEMCPKCVNNEAMWDTWPCNECSINPFEDDASRNLFYCPRG